MTVLTVLISVLNWQQKTWQKICLVNIFFVLIFQVHFIVVSTITITSEKLVSTPRQQFLSGGVTKTFVTPGAATKHRLEKPNVVNVKKTLRLDDPLDNPLDLSFPSPAKTSSRGQDERQPAELYSSQPADTDTLSDGQVQQRSVSFYKTEDSNLVWLLPPSNLPANCEEFDGQCKSIIIQPSPYLATARPESLVIRVQSDTNLKLLKDYTIHHWALLGHKLVDPILTFEGKPFT